LKEGALERLLADNTDGLVDIVCSTSVREQRRSWAASCDRIERQYRRLPQLLVPHLVSEAYKINPGHPVQDPKGAEHSTPRGSLSLVPIALLRFETKVRDPQAPGVVAYDALDVLREAIGALSINIERERKGKGTARISPAV
jgi:hypothetical protein